MQTLLTMIIKTYQNIALFLDGSILCGNKSVGKMHMNTYIILLYMLNSL